jgi:hypothetical protein
MSCEELWPFLEFDVEPRNPERDDDLDDFLHCETWYSGAKVYAWC